MKNSLRNPAILSIGKNERHLLTKKEFFMSVSPAGNGSMIMSIVNQATALQAAQLQTSVDVAVLSNALDVQKELAAELIQSMGVGQNVDIEV